MLNSSDCKDSFDIHPVRRCKALWKSFRRVRCGRALWKNGILLSWLFWSWLPWFSDYYSNRRCLVAFGSACQWGLKFPVSVWLPDICVCTSVCFTDFQVVSVRAWEHRVSVLCFRFWVPKRRFVIVCESRLWCCSDFWVPELSFIYMKAYYFRCSEHFPTIFFNSSNLLPRHKKLLYYLNIYCMNKSINSGLLSQRYSKGTEKTLNSNLSSLKKSNYYSTISPGSVPSPGTLFVTLNP